MLATWITELECQSDKKYRYCSVSLISKCNCGKYDI
jgi:hypothetical protein